MPNLIKGSSRLVIGRFLYDWQHGDRCLLAYSSSGNMGVVATVPDKDGNAPDLWSIAARHESRTASYEDLARWCLCVGWSMTMKPRQQWISAVDQPWALEVRATLPSVKPHQYGNTAYGWNGAHIGVLRAENSEFQNQAHRLLELQDA
jgi:hypothetical protein